MSAPPTVHIHQYQTETIAIGWDFTQSVEGALFQLEHSLYGSITLVGAAKRVEVEIDETKAATAVGTYTYVLTANPGDEGSEEIAARGRWFVEAREPT